MKSILLIDDDPTLLTMTAMVLERAGFMVVCAKDGKEGLRLFGKAAYDLVISDFVMAVIEGMETMMAIRHPSRQEGLWEKVSPLCQLRFAKCTN